MGPILPLITATVDVSTDGGEGEGQLLTQPTDWNIFRSRGSPVSWASIRVSEWQVAIAVAMGPFWGRSARSCTTLWKLTGRTTASADDGVSRRRRQQTTASADDGVSRRRRQQTTASADDGVSRRRRKQTTASADDELASVRDENTVTIIGTIRTILTITWQTTKKHLTINNPVWVKQIAYTSNIQMITLNTKTKCTTITTNIIKDR